MTREEKQILLKDLCARLPYGLKVQIQKLDEDKIIDNEDFGYMWLGIVLFDNPYHQVKPYLRPMSSMTEEEKEEFDKVLKSCNNKVFACPDKERRYNFFDAEQEDFMNAHHFDYRGLIPMGLALEAPEGMYKTE